MSIHKPINYTDLSETWKVNKTMKFDCKVATSKRLITRKPSIEAGIRRNAISNTTWNEI